MRERLECCVIILKTHIDCPAPAVLQEHVARMQTMFGHGRRVIFEGKSKVGMGGLAVQEQDGQRLQLAPSLGCRAAAYGV